MPLQGSPWWSRDCCERAWSKAGVPTGKTAKGGEMEGMGPVGGRISADVGGGGWRGG